MGWLAEVRSPQRLNSLRSIWWELAVVLLFSMLSKSESFYGSTKPSKKKNPKSNSCSFLKLVLNHILAYRMTVKKSPPFCCLESDVRVPATPGIIAHRVTLRKESMQGGTERCKEPGSLAMWTTIPTPNAFF